MCFTVCLTLYVSLCDLNKANWGKPLKLTKTINSWARGEVENLLCSNSLVVIFPSLCLGCLSLSLWSKVWSTYLLTGYTKSAFHLEAHLNLYFIFRARRQREMLSLFLFKFVFKCPFGLFSVHIRLFVQCAVHLVWHFHSIQVGPFEFFGAFSYVCSKWNIMPLVSVSVSVPEVVKSKPTCIKMS